MNRAPCRPSAFRDPFPLSESSMRTPPSEMFSIRIRISRL
jgi:hypothetical protein